MFYDLEKASQNPTEMNDYLTSLHNDLLEGPKKDYRLKDYGKYFEVTSTPKRGLKI